MRITYFIVVFTIALYTTASAQFNETIRTARPGQAIGPFTVGKGIFQIQSGFDYFGTDISSLDFKSEGYLNNTVIRYGLTEPFEISALIEYKTETINQSDVESTLQGLSAIDIGMRYHIHSGKGLIPNVAFQIRMRLPVLGEDYEIKDIAPRFIIVTNQRLSEKFTLFTNLGAAWNGNDSSPRGVYVVNLAFPLTDKLGAYVETYGGIHQGVMTTNFDTGLGWLLTNDLQLDLYGGYGSNHGVKDFFVSTGVSWRTKRKGL